MGWIQLRPPPTHPNELIVDSCLTGGGGHFGNLWYSYKFPSRIIDRQLSISQLEMLNTLVGLKLLAPYMHGHIVGVRCDNIATVCTLQNNRARCNTLLACAREIWRVTAAHQVQLRVSHIMGSSNETADILSRAHLSPKYHDELQKLIACHNPMFLPVTDELFDY